MAAHPLLGGLLLTALLAGCASGPTQPTSPGPTAMSAETPSTGTEVGAVRENGVEVRFRWNAGNSSSPVLAVTFTPLIPGFHLYSVDLPPEGVQGVGRPTSVQVGGGLKATGPPSVDRPVIALRVAGVDAPVSVYPDGAVTLRLPAQPVPGQTALSWIGYAACSRSTCMPPVTHRRVTLSLRGST